MIEIVKNAISVKNAVLAKDDQYYYVVHYDTIVLKIKMENSGIKEILTLLPVSNSSENAIIDALNYLGLSSMDVYNLFDAHVERLNGLDKYELKKMWKFKRYNQPERRKKAEIENIVNDLIGADLNQ